MLAALDLLVEELNSHRAVQQSAILLQHIISGASQFYAQCYGMLLSWLSAWLISERLPGSLFQSCV